MDFILFVLKSILFHLRTMYRNRNANDLAVPPGYNLSVGQNHNEVAMDNDQNHLILKKSWDIALGPIKQVMCRYVNFTQIRSVK